MDAETARELERVYVVLAKVVEILERIRDIAPAERDELRKAVEEGQRSARSKASFLNEVS